MGGERRSVVLVFGVLVITLQLTEEMPAHSGVGRAGARVRARHRTARGASCSEMEYLEGNICCLKCPAGTYLKSACTSEGQRGVCVECDFGTYTEHDNNLHQCWKCTKCRSDQKAVRKCTSTLDSECQCKPGMFCAPDQACEVCKKCSSCKDGKEKVKNCTATFNTECSKGLSSSNASAVTSDSTIIVIVIIVIAIAIAIAVVIWKWKNGTLPCSQKESIHGTEVEMVAVANGFPEGGQAVEVRRRLLPQSCPEAVRPNSSASEEDEDRGLGCSLANSSCNSQSSLSGHPTQSGPAHIPPQTIPVVPWQPSVGVHDQFPTLVPLHGEEECLRKCFHYFEDELNVDYYKRFFRHLGVKDNMIRSSDQREDWLHELLDIWLEKEGKEASVNTLLKALLTLKQRLTAETIVKRAVADGLYECKEEVADI